MRSKCGGPIGEKSSFHRSFNGAWMKNPTVSYSVTRILLGVAYPYPIRFGYEYTPDTFPVVS